jgi:anti-sigma factor RsiW
MADCLTDDELVLAYYGEGSPGQATQRSAHLAWCSTCVRRLRTLSADLDTIRTALSEPVAVVAQRPRRWRGLAVAAALAGLSVVGVTEIWIWHAARWMTAVASEVDPETSAFLDRVSSMLSTGDDPNGAGEDME